MSLFIRCCLLMLALSGVWACTTDAVDPEITAATQNAADIKAYIRTRPDSTAFKTTTSGLRYLITNSVPGAKVPGLGEEVSFTFRSYNLQGQLVDSTSASNPIYFPFGLGLLLFGIEEGLSYMREGERATVLVPARLAYGGQTKTNLPAYSPVRFELSLLRALTEGEQITRYLRANKLTLTDSSSTGLKIIKTVNNPTGNAVVTGQTVKVAYAGSTLRTGQTFDSGTFNVVLGTTQVIAGFEEGVRRLRVGEKATIILPSALGYGARGSVNSSNVYVINPYEPILFTIEIVSAQ